MTNMALQSSIKFLKVVIILIIYAILPSCSSNHVASVNERSKQYDSKGKVHTVAQGETLFSIAWRYGLDYKKMAEFNGIKSPYIIYPSQKIRVDLRALKPNTTVNSDSDISKNNNTSNSKKSVLANNKSSEKRPKNSSIFTDDDNFQSPPKWQWPTSGNLIASFQGDSELNKGIDLGGKLGEPVLAAASGRVVYAGSGLSGYGKLLIIKHSEVFLSAYAHNSELLVKEGDFIKGGQRIADMGSSGTDRVKLHFEIRSEGSPVNPLNYLPKRQ
jgi:lipoprotein NlpD